MGVSRALFCNLSDINVGTECTSGTITAQQMNPSRDGGRREPPWERAAHGAVLLSQGRRWHDGDAGAQGSPRKDARNLLLADLSSYSSRRTTLKHPAQARVKTALFPRDGDHFPALSSVNF